MSDTQVNPAALRVLIIDRHEVSRAAVCALLRTEGLEVVADVATAAEGLALADELKPDVAIVDVNPAGAQALVLAGALGRLAAGVVLTSSTPVYADLKGYTFFPKSEICARVLRQALPAPAPRNQGAIDVDAGLPGHHHRQDREDPR
jgi:hypothetical protein